MLELEPQTILDLPLERLALLVLADYAATDSWNFRNWLMSAETRLGRGQHLGALAEAWAWLEARTLVAPDPLQSSSEARTITRAGKRVIESGSIAEVVASERLGLDLHPRLQAKVRPIFLLGDYETAAFKAMKEVEVRVRELARLPNELIGVRLMREAFKVNNGPLTDRSHDKGEQQARSDLFAGAIGSFKNPTSHRPVSYGDPIEASEVVLLSDLLMRILDSVAARIERETKK